MRGGYQKPASPAPVSGPGALSKRTDGGPAQAVRSLPDAKYGENRDFVAAEQAAPMASAPSLPAPGGAATPSPGAPFVHPMGAPPSPLTAGTQAPDVPVTDGAAAGAGSNSMTLPMGQQYTTVAQRLQQLASASGNPDIQFLAGMAGQGRF